MIIDQKIQIHNYKCFDTKGAGFQRILPINIIIGKNNSGKSSLIDLIRFYIDSLKNKDESIETSTYISVKKALTITEISRVFRRGTSGGGIHGDHFDYGRKFIGHQYECLIRKDNKAEFVNIDLEYDNGARQYIEDIAPIVEKPLNGKRFCHITAERDIIPEPSVKELKWKSNGSGVTNTIQKIINQTKEDSRLIESDLLNELNKIIQPDIYFKRILVQIDENDYWQIFFEDKENNRIALSKMGSGIKTVLLVLLDLIVLPIIDKLDKINYVYAFEELENNLHPALQRRLYNYIQDYSKQNSVYFFLTTHSNVVIDSFGMSENAQIIHVINDENRSFTKTVSSNSETKAILKDLDIKASDLLQTNGIIWVEGPSDRNYINKWLSILAPDLREGLNYSIMFYGGKLLSHLSFDYEWFNKEIIPLLKINTNAFVVMDRDGKTITANLNNTKIRINNEIGEDNCWVTNGREIENYLSNNIIRNWLKSKYGYETIFENEKNTKLEDNIINCSSKMKIIYNQNKTLYSSEIIEFIDRDSIKTLDLEAKLNTLINNIKIWNSIN